MTATTSPSGARIQGDDFQHLYGWYQALRMLIPEHGVDRVEIESDGAGNLDDVVVRRPAYNDEYVQVKYSVDARNPVTSDWLTTPLSARGKSPLQRFAASWAGLRKPPGKQPGMTLFTNRVLDPEDPILMLRDGQRGVVGPRLAQETPGSKAGRQMARWASHAGLSQPDLIELLSHLTFKTDQGASNALVEATCDRMRSVGLRARELDASAGVAAVRDWVKTGVRTIDASQLAAEIERRDLKGGVQYSTLLVEAIDHTHWPDGAAAHLDWVNLFEGTEPRARVQLRDPSLWSTKIRPEMVAAARALEAKGASRIVVRGYMRLPLWFLAGAELPDTRGHQVACSQNGAWWSSETAASAYEVMCRRMPLDQGGDLAVGLSVTNRVVDDVLTYCKRAALPCGTFLEVAGAKGVNRTAIADNAEAVGWAHAVRDAVRCAVRDTGARRVHLFISGPAGGSLLLGHSWNRVAPTIVYEHLGSAGYVPTFELP
ncbi:MAG: SAVED domain-containing protein [Archangium sp.]|nr:SAVED domain-containing protein [Archangium sp.]